MRLNPEHESSLNHLVSEFEAMSKEGSVTFLTEQDFVKLINYYEDEFLFDKALKVTECAIKQHGFSADFHIRKAQLLLSMRNSESAMSSLDQAEIFAPSEIEIQVLRAKVFISIGEYSNALMILNVEEDIYDPVDVSDIYVCKAQVYECLKEYDKMFDALIHALVQFPENEEALERIWVCTELTKDYQRSIDFHLSLIDRNPYNYLAWYNLGHAHACEGNYKEAIEAYEYSFIINEDFELGYRDCADLCHQIQKYNQALDYYLDTLQKFGPDSELLANIGECHFFEKDYEEAKLYFNKASKLDPYNDEVYYYLGLCHFHEDRFLSAINSFFKAIEIEDRREEYFANMAKSFAKIGEFSKANYYFLKATEIGPEQSEIWIAHATFLLSIGEKNRALEVIEDAEFHAVGTELQYCAAACEYALGRSDRAKTLLKEALHDDSAMHTIIQDIWPSMMKDQHIKSLIQYYLLEV